MSNKKAYIDLRLECVNKTEDNQGTCRLSDAIQKDDIVVLLGAPGSGKTSILKKYEAENPKRAKLRTVKQFLMFQDSLEELKDYNVILLDGLDEHRSIANDKSFVVSEIGNKIKKLKGKIVISCREMDWYGEADEAALKDEIHKAAAIYRILPLNEDEKITLAERLVRDKDAFISNFDKSGLLDNPQSFFMLAEIFKNNPKKIIQSKTGLYKEFIKISKEANDSYKINNPEPLNEKELFKFSGYLACFYIFCGIDNFKDSILDNIIASDDNYPVDKLKAVLKTRLFTGRQFIHRTIAEFLCADYLNKNKIEVKIPLSIQRVKSLFVKDNRIPTELRGTFAWLCSLSGIEDFIQIDPYYQCIHGDSSLFDLKLKRDVVLEVEKYANEQNPYFINFEPSASLEGFYEEQLDDFLIDRFEEAFKLKNHYIYFIIDILVSANKLSRKLEEFLKIKLLNNELQSYCKSEIIEYFKDDTAFLEEILSKILEQEISDEGDRLKEVILRILYPKHIKPKDIVKYLMLYNETVYGYCRYLYKTDYKDKRELVEEIHRQSYDESRVNPLSLPENIVSFIEDYFFETVLKYEEELSAEKIYEIINGFRKYYRKYDAIKFHSYRNDLTGKQKEDEEKLQKLSNELYSLYIKEKIQGEFKPSDTYRFNHLFNFGYQPTNQVEVLLHYIGLEENNPNNKNLFFAALSHINKDRQADLTRFKDIAERYNFTEIYNDWLNPQKQQWEIDDEKRQEEIKREEQEILDSNEAYFAKKSDDEVLNSFRDMSYVSRLLFIEHSEPKCLSGKTLERLKKILENTIYQSSFDKKLTSLDSISQDTKKSFRHIDILYYVACALNKETKFGEIRDKSFLGYLYINYLIHNVSCNIIKGVFPKQLESQNKEFAIATLKEYVNLLFKNHCPHCIEGVSKYIKKSSLQELKPLATMSVAGLEAFADTLIYRFVATYNFSIDIKDLERLKSLTTNQKICNLVNAIRLIKNEDKGNFNIDMATEVYLLFRFKYLSFAELGKEYKVRIVDYLMNIFNTEESIQFVSGFQSDKSLCASFLSREALNILDIDSLEKLRELHESDVWKPRIQIKISQKRQAMADETYQGYPIEGLKNFLTSDTIVSPQDFFYVVCDALERLAIKIADNRDNDKKPFFKDNGLSKNENDCRDLLVIRLNDKYGKDWALPNREHQEGNNRADINIKYKANTSFEVQVECKKHSNKDLYDGIQNQLIDKYMGENSPRYGIYLVFYFADKEKDKATMTQKLKKEIPAEYNDRVSVITFDLSR